VQEKALPVGGFRQEVKTCWTITLWVRVEGRGQNEQPVASRRASLAWLRNCDAGIAIAVGRRGGESSLRVNSLYFEFSIADYYRAFWW